ncbi:MAG TPA: hypothetical protein VHA78_01695 [Candidatus Peribacteraceae bacterium]|nr:hypothetical protein [Candidatus Peribacteraceae bacterium]
MAYSFLRRFYLFSDTYGRSKNPFLQDDADALISTDFRSTPLETVRREFDIYGRETITEHVLRMVIVLNRNTKNSPYLPQATKDEFAQSLTGVFINAAPRLTRENGTPFYVATVDDNIRIVTTSLSGLSTIKSDIQTLHHLDNDKNIIYGNTEQFRSSYMPYLLHPDHGIDLIEDKIDIIPDYPDDKWELAYVDRFGNMVTYTKDVEKKWNEVSKAADANGSVKLIVGNVSQTLFLGSSLRDAEPGSLVVYKNNDIDLLRKWMPNEDSYTRLYRSAYLQFSKPEVGAAIKIAD